MTDEIDTYLTDEIICPYCGSENCDESTEPDGETVCCECDKAFMFRRDYSIKYISEKMKGDEN